MDKRKAVGLTFTQPLDIPCSHRVNGGRWQALPRSWLPGILNLIVNCILGPARSFEVSLAKHTSRITAPTWQVLAERSSVPLSSGQQSDEQEPQSPGLGPCADARSRGKSTGGRRMALGCGGVGGGK